MITREDAQKFFSQDKVWVYDNVGSAIEGEPWSIGRKDGLFMVENSAWYQNFSLEDPRPKRVFEDGALYPISVKGSLSEAVGRYRKSENVFKLDGGAIFNLKELYFIGDKLPSELWGKNE